MTAPSAQKELLNAAILIFAITLILSIFISVGDQADIAMMLAVGLLAFLFFIFNPTLMLSFFIAMSFFDFTIEGLTYFKLLGYVVLVVLLLNASMKQVHLDLNNRIMLLFMAIFLLCTAGQLFNNSFELFYLSKLMMIFWMMMAIRAFVTRLEDLKFVLFMLAIAGVVAAGVTIYEIVLDPDIERASGSLGNPNNTAAIFSMLLPFSMVLLGRKNRWPAFFFSAFVILMLLAAIFITASRGALLSLAAIAAAALVMFNLRGKVITVALLLFSFLVFFNVFDNFRGLKRYEQLLTTGNVMESPAAKVRVEISMIGLQLFTENPVWGVGAGNFQSETKDMETEYNGYLYGGIAPHNMYTQILAELGITGFLLFGWFYYSIFQIIYMRTRYPDPEIRRVAKMLLFSFIAIMVSMVTSGNYVNTFIYIVAGFALVIEKLTPGESHAVATPQYARAALL